MPKKDGTPTAAERKNIERRESNRRYIVNGGDLSDLENWTLQEVQFELADDAAVVAAINAELARREASCPEEERRFGRESKD